MFIRKLFELQQILWKRQLLDTVPGYHVFKIINDIGNHWLPLPVSQRFTNRALYHGESPSCSWWTSHPIPHMVPWWSFHHDSSFSIPKSYADSRKRLKQHRAHNDGLALGKCLLTAAPGKKWHQHQKKTCTKIQANEKAQNLSKNPKEICKNIKTISLSPTSLCWNIPGIAGSAPPTPHPRRLSCLS